MRQFAAQRAFFEPAREFAFNAESGGVDFNPLLMLAIERALAPPLVQMRSIFQPMRIVVVDPDSVMRADCEVPMGIPNLLPRTLASTADSSNSGASQFRQRAIRGEILSDEDGRLYEKLGRQIRPINQLASGPFGEVVDLVPAAQPGRRMIAPTTGPTLVNASATATAQSRAEEKAIANGDDSAKPKFAPIQQEPPQQNNVISHRKLFADPGQWRVVWWGEFKEILARQLAHPERLRDTYRLPCYIQVIEAERTVAIEELATAYNSDNKCQTPLYLLTDEIGAKLDLVLPLRPAPPRNARRVPNTLLPHERVFRLIAANDPTIDVATSKKKMQSPAANAEALGATGQGNELAPASAGLKEAIPNRFVKEWEYKISREEASYDMNAKPTLGRLIRNFCRRFKVGKHRNEFRKWQILLAGKNADEQLWAVRPPAGLLADSLVRDWAKRTLELGGYDSRKMIGEWEIFWRRRGL